MVNKETRGRSYIPIRSLFTFYDVLCVVFMYNIFAVISI